MGIRTPLSDLIRRRSCELGLSFEAIGFRLGYTNPAKAAGRVTALCDAVIESDKSQRALKRLHQALELPGSEVQFAVQKTRDLLAEQARLRQAALDEQRRVEYKQWKAQFKPHAVLLGTETRPSQITIFAWTGGPENWLVIRPDLSQPPVTFIPQVVKCLDRRLPRKENGKQITPFFGEAQGFVMNFSPDYAVRCTMEGEPLEVLERAYRAGYSYAAIGSRKISAEEAARLLSGGGYVD